MVNGQIWYALALKSHSFNNKKKNGEMGAIRVCQKQPFYYYYGKVA